MGRERNSCFMSNRNITIIAKKSIIDRIIDFIKKLFCFVKRFFSKQKSVYYPQSQLDKKRRLQDYEEYLETLATNESPELFSNGGVDYAAILMSVLLKHTKKEALIFSHGFKAELIMKQPYWNTLIEFLKNPEHKLSVLVETDNFVKEGPMQLLKEINKSRKTSGKGNQIKIKLLSPKAKKIISNKFGEEPCNFAIYDTDKFRFEYDPVEFKAYGSFNQPENCKVLTRIFNKAFKESEVLILDD